jgi:hypothetical protein
LEEHHRTTIAAAALVSFADNQRQTQPQVSRDRGEAPRGIAIPEVRGPAADEPVDAPDDRFDRQQQPRPVGEFPDPVEGVLHGLVRGPTGQEYDALARATPIAADQPMMKPEEIKWVWLFWSDTRERVLMRAVPLPGRTVWTLIAAATHPVDQGM